MDFSQALNTSGFVIFLLLVIALLTYAYRTKEIYNDVTEGTRKALWGYGFSGIGMAATAVFGVSIEIPLLVTSLGAFFLGSIAFAQVWVLFPAKRARIFSAILGLLIITVLADSIIRLFNPGFPIYLLLPAMAILLLSVFIFSIILIKETPSTFTVSIFIMILLFLTTWVLGVTRWIVDNPEYYILAIVPLVIAAAIFISVRRPLRTTLSSFIGMLMVTVNVPLMYLSLQSGEWMIWVFVFMNSYTLLCLIAPLNFFIQQASDTGARTPMYLAVVVSFISGFLILHSMGWAGYITNGFVWNRYMVWIITMAGITALVGYVLAAVSSALGEWSYVFAREGLVVYWTTIALLTFPTIQDALLPFTGFSDYEVFNAYVRVTVAMVVLIGLVIFSRVALKLYRAGAKPAAIRLVLFLFSIVLIAVTVMLSFAIHIAIAVLILSIAGILALLSSPPVAARLARTIRKLDELSDLGVQEDGSIRW